MLSCCHAYETGNHRNRLRRPHDGDMLRRGRAQCDLRRQQCGENRIAAAGKHTDLRARARGSHRVQRRCRAPELQYRFARFRGAVRHHLHRRADSPSERRLGRSLLHRIRLAGNRPSAASRVRLPHCGRQIDRSGQHGQQGGAGDRALCARRRRCGRGFQPGILARGQRRGRSDAPRPHRHRREFTARYGPHEARLPALQRAHRRGGSSLGRADQACRQLLLGSQNLVHQRRGGRLRALRRGCDAGGARHRDGPPHLAAFPQCRARLRRLLLPERRQGLHPRLRTVGRTHEPVARGRGHQRAPDDALHRPHPRKTLGAAQQTRGRLGHCLQAEHRRRARIRRRQDD